MSQSIIAPPPADTTKLPSVVPCFHDTRAAPQNPLPQILRRLLVLFCHSITYYTDLTANLYTNSVVPSAV